MSAQRSATQDANSADFRFGSERDALRSEDVPLVTGRGKFTDDLDMTRQVHAAFVRATVAHAIVRKVDVAAATKMPGVVAVLTGSDLAADNIGGIPPVASFNGRDGSPMFHATMPVLAAERVRYVGEAIATRGFRTPVAMLLGAPDDALRPRRERADDHARRGGDAAHLAGEEHAVRHPGQLAAVGQRVPAR